MTGRERILAAFHGELPDRIPFAPNLYQWFYYHQARGALPADLADARHPFDALRALGADILARWDTAAATREHYDGVECEEGYAGTRGLSHEVITAFNRYPPGRQRRRRSFHTPKGVLTETWEYSADAGADFQSEFCWKHWDDYPAVRRLLEARRYSFDAALFRAWRDRAGQDGVVAVCITQSPLKTFHWLAGAENTSYFAADHPDEMRELARIHEERALHLVDQVANLPEAEVFLSLDNLDSLFYPPRLYREYCASFFTRAAKRIHQRGKVFVVHACGRNRALLPLVGACQVDCLEGITPPPLGDVDLSRAREMAGWEHFTVNGGIDAGHLVLHSGAEAAIHEYTRGLFASLRDRRWFIFASSCSTPVNAPWDNLKYFRDAARAFGGNG